jgi:hypothetical protein
LAVAAVNEQGDVGDYSHPVTVRTLPGELFSVQSATMDTLVCLGFTSKESTILLLGATMGIVLGFCGAVIGCLFYYR